MLLRKSIPLLLISLLLSPLSAIAQSIEELAQQGIDAYRAGDYDAAVVAWQQMIELEPQNTDAYNNLGATLYQLGELDAAADAYRQALEIDGTSADTYNNLGTVLALQVKYDGGLSESHRAKS